MNGLEFLIELLFLISFDVIVGFTLFLIYKYMDLKYFSNLEIEKLKEENKYLREENKKINGTNSSFWGSE